MEKKQFGERFSVLMLSRMKHATGYTLRLMLANPEHKSGRSVGNAAPP